MLRLRKLPPLSWYLKCYVFLTLCFYWIYVASGECTEAKYGWLMSEKPIPWRLLLFYKMSASESEQKSAAMFRLKTSGE